MNVLLAAPSQRGIYGRLSAPDFPPIGLGYLAAVLERSGNKVRIADIDAEGMTEAGFARLLKEGDFGLVGITTTTATFNQSLKLAAIVKRDSGARTVLGGIHATTMPEDSIKHDEVDFVVVGEGEVTLEELVKAVGGKAPPGSVKGIYYKEGGRIVRTGDREPVEDLDKLPFPARHLYKNQSYTYPDTLELPVFPMITSRGCPASCTYCAANRIFRRTFRMRTPGNIADEMEMLVRSLKAREIHIWDDNFTLVKERVFRTRDEVVKRSLDVRIAFPNGLRVDSVDEEILRALKEMGTYSIAFGVESGCQETLDRVRKGTKLKKIEEAFALAKRAGIETWAFFILGLPDENDGRIRKTIDFSKRIDPDVAKFHILKPFPGTEVYDELSEEGLIIDNDFDNYGLHTPPVHRLKELTPDQILRWQKRAYREFYLRPGVMLRHLLRLKSFNRIKLNMSVAGSILKNLFN